MLGAVIGDICGSVYEFANLKTENPDEVDLTRPDCVFTDDTVLTCAVADACLLGKKYGTALHEWGRRFPESGYGGRFSAWLQSDTPEPYDSWGNGSAMRVSPVAWACSSLEDVLREAQRSAESTHNHPEGIRGAQATAAAIFLARANASKEDIRQYIEAQFQYDLQRTVASIRPTYSFKVSCQRTVPESLIVFLESRDFENALKLAVSIGGDTDTIACIVGSIAEAYYKDIPEFLRKFARGKIPESILHVMDTFRSKHCSHLRERG